MIEIHEGEFESLVQLVSVNDCRVVEVVECDKRRREVCSAEDEVGCCSD